MLEPLVVSYEVTVACACGYQPPEHPAWKPVFASAAALGVRFDV